MKKMTYEKALERLQATAEKLDEGDLPLEESLKLFEESTELTDFCTKSLQNAKLKITKLSQQNTDDNEE